MSNEGNKGPPSAITIGFSILTHFLLVAPVIYILVVAFENYSFFSWHPICMSVGVSTEKKNRLQYPIKRLEQLVQFIASVLLQTFLFIIFS